jgi:hypothetical protein
MKIKEYGKGSDIQPAKRGINSVIRLVSAGRTRTGAINRRAIPCSMVPAILMSFYWRRDSLRSKLRRERSQVVFYVPHCRQVVFFNFFFTAVSSSKGSGQPRTSPHLDSPADGKGFSGFKVWCLSLGDSDLQGPERACACGPRLATANAGHQPAARGEE